MTPSLINPSKEAEPTVLGTKKDKLPASVCCARVPAHLSVEVNFALPR
jgi:hypothetical protein